LYGYNVTKRDGYLIQTQPGTSYVENDIILPAGTIRKVYIYVQAPNRLLIRSPATGRVRLQIWRPVRIPALAFQLVWEQIVLVNGGGNALYTVIEVNLRSCKFSVAFHLKLMILCFLCVSDSFLLVGIYRAASFASLDPSYIQHDNAYIDNCLSTAPQHFLSRDDRMFHLLSTVWK
jgi:hypothetical protein